MYPIHFRGEIMGADTKTCKYCQSEVPKKASVCPQCRKTIGTTPAAKGCLTIFLGFLLIGMCSALITPDTNTSTSTKKSTVQKKKAPKTRAEKIKEQFSAWDGSHRKLERLVKKAMNDPDSYKHDETVYWDMKDHLVVRTTFRGRNAFGGMVKNWVKAKVDINTGDVLEVMEQGQ